jgi:hypothetical protein
MRRILRVSRILGFFAGTVILTTVFRARADDSAPIEDRAVPAPVPKGGPPLVVVADLGGTSTSSAELRAALYQVARDHGFDPASKVDVEGIASRSSLMAAGKITDDPKELQRLRAALSVDVVVRVSKVEDREDGIVRITVVTVDNVQTRLLREDTKEAVAHALDVLLPRQDGGSRTPTTFGDDQHVQAVEPSTHQLWEARSGLRPTFGAMAFASVTSFKVAYTGAGPDGTGTVPGTATAIGVGGGIGARLGLMYFPTLEPNPTHGTFFAFRAGFGLDTDFLYLRTPTGYSYSDSTRSTVYGNRGLWIGSVPFELGGAVGLGRFSGDSAWHGSMLGIAYAPQLQFSMELSKTSGDFRFNPAGAQISVDITTLDASHGNEPSAQIRIAVWGLAPLGDSHPWVVNLGIGAIWY